MAASAASVAFPRMLESGLDAYEDFYRWISSPAVTIEHLEDRETAASLPVPDPAMPIRVLASLAHHARASTLEFHYLVPNAPPELSHWYDSYGPRISELVPEAMSRAALWSNWSPPRRMRTPGSVPIDWLELRSVAEGFAGDRAPGLASLTFVFVRDWAFRLIEPYPKLDLDEVLDKTLIRLRVADDVPLNFELESLVQREREVRERAGGEVTTVWSLAIALALDEGPLAAYDLIDRRYPFEDAPIGSASQATEPAAAPAAGESAEVNEQPTDRSSQGPQARSSAELPPPPPPGTVNPLSGRGTMSNGFLTRRQRGTC